jgi:hypothetical protein
LSNVEAVELTFDVMRNASNKIAVALGGDAARVEHGTERYLHLLDADGLTVSANCVCVTRHPVRPLVPRVAIQ